MEAREWLVIGRSVAAMFAGSIIVEIQLNQLTYWLDFVQVFNLRRVSEGAYLAYMLGTEYGLQAVWQIGTISVASHALEVNLFGVSIAIPTQVQIDASAAFDYLQLLWRNGLASAFVIKRQTLELLADCGPLLHFLLREAAAMVR